MKKMALVVEPDSDLGIIVGWQLARVGYDIYQCTSLHDCLVFLGSHNACLVAANAFLPDGEFLPAYVNYFQDRRRTIPPLITWTSGNEYAPASYVPVCTGMLIKILPMPLDVESVGAFGALYLSQRYEHGFKVRSIRRKCRRCPRIRRR